MSYILDALRRAEEERRQNVETELHEQIVAPVEREALSPVPRGGWLIAGAGVVLAVGVAFTAWQLRGRAPATGPAEPAVVPVAQALAPAPVVAAQESPPAAAAIAPEPSPAVARPRAAAAPAPSQPVATPVPVAQPPQPPRVLRMAELPDEIRRALPPMRFEGTIYSTNPASRMLMINGQLLHEGEAFTADVTVEEIKPRSAVLRYRSQRFELAQQ